MKRLTSRVALLLILILICNMCCIMVSNAKEVTTALEVEKALNVFGIIDDEDTEDSEYITRSELAMYLVRMVGEDDVTKVNGNLTFEDVDNSHPYFPYINKAVSLGMMKGYSDTDFSPNDYVTYGQSANVLLKLLNYDFYADLNSGFLNAALQKKLVEGRTVLENRYIGRQDFYSFVFNCLNANVLEQTSYGNKVKYQESKSKTLLSEKLSIYKHTGTVNATERNSLKPLIYTPIKNTVVIDGKSYYDGNVDIEEQLGCRITFYSQYDAEDSSEELVWLMENHSENDILLLDAEDIYDESTLDNIKYTNENDEISNANLDSNAMFIFNGTESNRITVDNLMPWAGSIRLIDSDSNGKYDIVMITSYITYFVNYFDSVNGVIYDSYGSKEIDKKQATQIDVFYGSDVPIDFSDIRQNDVLFVAADKEITVDGVRYIDTENSKYYKIIVADQHVSGTVRTIENGDNGIVENVQIDDDNYEVAESFRKALAQTERHANIKNIEIGANGNFYLDFNGKIAAYESLASTTEKFGFLVAYNITDTLDKRSEFKIFASDGEFYVVEGAERIEIDGVRYKNNGDIQPVLTYFNFIDNETDTQCYKRRIIVFELNDSNQLTKLITTRGTVKSKDDLIKELQSLQSVNFRYNSNAFQLNGSEYFFMTPGTTIQMAVPDVESITDESLYYISRKVYYDNNTETLAAYAKGKDYMADVILTVADSNGIAIDDNSAILPSILVEKITLVIGEEGNAVQKLSGYEGFAQIELYGKTTNTFENIKPGDVIRCRKNSKGIVEGYEKYYSIGSTSLGSDLGNSTLRSMAYGEVYDIQDNVIAIGLGSDISRPDSIRAINTARIKKVLIFDTATEKVSFGTVDDIRDYLHFADSGSVIFYHQRYLLTLSLVIYV